METGIVLTDSAADKVSELMQDEENKADIKLRLYIQGGGCSGFSYGFAFTDKIEDGDSIIENGDVTLLVDCMSVQYLMGASVDWVEELWGAKFVINNPNSATTCGCGESFTV